MNLSTYIQELQESLKAAAALGDENSQRSATAIASALEPAARLALIHAMSDLAAEVTRQLRDTTPPGGESISVDVRLDGRDVSVGTTRQRTTSTSSFASSTAESESGGFASSSAGADGESHRSFTDVSGDLTRTTVRMFNELKAQAERAAAEQGVSLNSFISRAVADSIRTDIPRKWKGRSEHGFGRFEHGAEQRGDAPTQSSSTIRGYVQG